MSHTLLRHLRHNVVGYLALFIALGGTSYAASQLPKNSVSSTQIKDKSAKEADLATSAVSSRVIKDGTITDKDLAKGTLKQGAPGAAGPQGTAGPQGPAGPQGAQGPAGAQGEKGADGAPGANGKDGKNGTDGDDGAPGASGPQGPAGPTWGTSVGGSAIQGVETVIDPATVTTPSAGRLLVSKTMAQLQVNCGGGSPHWRYFLTLDGAVVPGTVVHNATPGSTRYDLTLMGVTADPVAAGNHTVGIGVDCTNGANTAATGTTGHGATVVLLGN